MAPDQSEGITTAAAYPVLLPNVVLEQVRMISEQSHRGSIWPMSAQFAHTGAFGQLEDGAEFYAMIGEVGTAA